MVTAEGYRVMTPLLTVTKRSVRKPWSLEKLVRERAVALGFALDKSTHRAYASHLQSYVDFCDAHGFPLDPTPDTLSFYIVYMSHCVTETGLDASRVRYRRRG